ncbi:rCG35493, isoform CRA_b, partial [Rattus norvegicus]
MLAGGHRGRPVVVQVPRGVVGKVIEAVEGGAGRGRQRIRVATPAHIDRTALHGGRPVGSPVGLEDVGLILRRRGRGVLLWG